MLQSLWKSCPDGLRFAMIQRAIRSNVQTRTCEEKAPLTGFWHIGCGVLVDLGSGYVAQRPQSRHDRAYRTALLRGGDPSRTNRGPIRVIGPDSSMWGQSELMGPMLARELALAHP